MATEEISLAWIIGQNVRRLRKTRGWTMEALERRTKIPQSAISRYEGGQSVPTTARLAALALALGATPNDLMSWPPPSHSLGGPFPLEQTTAA